MSIKILSWNIWFGQHLSEIIHHLKQSNADIIGLEEVIQETDGTNNIAKIIADELGYEVLYITTMQGELNGKLFDWGKAILSKYKIVAHKTHVLSETETRKALEVTIQVKDETLHVFTTHLIHTHQQESEIQSLQATNLIKALPKDHVILMGDFNATPESAAVKKLSKLLNQTDKNLLPTWSVYPEGCGYCKPQKIEYKLDNIFVSKDLKAHSFKVEQSKGSDHLPISVLIDL